MREAAEYLLNNYYVRKGLGLISLDNLDALLEQYKEKVVVIKDEEKVIGVGVFLTLSDELFSEIYKFKDLKPEKLQQLLEEEGKNIHVILIATKGLRNILTGIKEIERKTKAETISWWSPNMNRLHKYNLR